MADLVLSEVVAPAAKWTAKWTLGKIWQELGYMCCYRSNIGDLNKQVQGLRQKRDGVNQEVKPAREALKTIDPGVVRWLGDVDKIMDEKETTFSDDIVAAKAACCYGWLPNLRCRHSLGRKAKKMTLEVDELRAKDLGIISHPAPHPDVEFQPTEESTHDQLLGINFHEGASSSETSNQEQPTALLNFDSRRSTIGEVMEALRGNQINPIIICGMGGMGKTTLMGQVHEKAKEEGLFDEYTKATVKESIGKAPDLNLIQDQLARYLGLSLEGNETEARASRLRERLSQGSKKVLVMLDNVSTTTPDFLWDIGIPHGCKLPHRCKLLVTSRQQDLFKDMDARKNFPIHGLSDGDAWSLFKKTAGSSIESDPRLNVVAKKVLKECAGLPIAISTVGTALKGESIAIWKNALRELERAIPENLPGVIEHVYGKIKLSYERLPNEQARSCLLLCCIFKEGADIRIEDLVLYGLGLGIFKGIDSMDEARDRVETLVQTLKSRFLLLDCDDNDPDSERVKMHDVVRDVAVHIASEERSVVRDTVETLKSIDWPMSDQGFRICRSLVNGGRCVLLQLKYGGHETEEAPTIIDGAEDLKVLEIVGPFRRLSLGSTLPSIAVLRNLKILRLQRCFLGPDVSLIGELRALMILSFRRSDIEELPDAFKNLSNLRFLDLTYCMNLKVIAPGVLSSLTRLEELYMLDSFKDWVVEKLTSTEASSWISQLEEEAAEVTTVEKWKSLNKLAVEQPANVGELFRKEVERDYWDSSEYTRWANSMDWETGILAELLSLSRLTTLEVVLPPLNVLQTTALFDKLERFKISIGWKKHKETWEFELRGNESNDNYLRVGELDESATVGGDSTLLLNKTTRLEFQRKNVEYLIDPKTIPHSNSAIFPLLKSLDISPAKMLKEIFPRELPTGSFKELRSLKLNYVNALPYIWKKTNNRSEWSVLRDILGLLQMLEIRKCESLEEIVAIEFENEEVINFQSLTDLTLRDLPNFTGIIKNISKGPERVPEGSSPEQSDVITQPLFNAKVHFPSLTGLDISYMNFKEIWNNQLPESRQAFQSLTKIDIVSCNSLKTLLPPSIAKGLMKLQILVIFDCEKIEEIVAAAAEGEETEDENMFPQLRILTLGYLPNLGSFSEGKYNFMWPLLEHVYILECPNMKKFCLGSLSIPKEVKIKVEENQESVLQELNNSRNEI